MRIVLHTDSIERRMGGATISTLQTLEVLYNLGHEAVVIAEKVEKEKVFGIKVYQENKPFRVKKYYSWADVVFAMRRPPVQYIKEYQRWDVPHGAPPIYSVYFAHNVGQPYKHGYWEGDIDFVVFNAEWVKQETGWSGESMVLHPPIFKDQYLIKPGDRITQINLAKKKGGELFWQIAKIMKEQKFLAVLGKESDQVVPFFVPKNVKLIKYTPDIRSVYAQTKILLMPSQGYRSQKRWTNYLWTESYGRVGVEAAISGIPVIAYPTPGIKEALGNDAIYCDNGVDGWVKEIRKLCDPKVYEAISKRVRAVGDRLTPFEDIRNLEKLLLVKVNEMVSRNSKQHKVYFKTI